MKLIYNAYRYHIYVRASLCLLLHVCQCVFIWGFAGSCSCVRERESIIVPSGQARSGWYGSKLCSFVSGRLRENQSSLIHTCGLQAGFCQNHCRKSHTSPLSHMFQHVCVSRTSKRQFPCVSLCLCNCLCIRSYGI